MTLKEIQARAGSISSYAWYISWILAGMLPQGLRGLFVQTRRFGFILFLLLAITNVLDYVLSAPVGLAWGGLEVLSWAMGFG